MSEAYIGELRIFAFAFAPKGWAMCNGQIMAISQNAALFSLLGTFYGGNGINTFALPNLQANLPIHQGQSPGGSSYTIGEIGGVASVTLQSNQTGHAHNVQANTTGSTSASAGNYPSGTSGVNSFAPAPDGVTQLAGTMVPQQGGSQPHTNMQPSLGVNICICLNGIFPSRN